MKKILRSGIFFFLLVVSVHLQAQTVTLDYYFNRELHQNATGQPERFHYMWEDTANTGFSNWGAVFKKKGAQLQSLNEAPTQANLKGTDVYIIVDPDTKKESAGPNYITTKDIDQIVRYVKNGGVLVLMANDSANVELPHFNQLAAKFGLHFNNDLHNHVIDDDHFANGGLTVTDNPFFKTAKKIFMKDIATLKLSDNDKSLLKDRDAVIIATTKYGKGTVFAVGDPWLYNEYLNGRLPAEYENDKAANDVSSWLLKQIPKTHAGHTQIKHTFSYNEKDFLLDGKPFVMISGEMHYPRVPREAWRARMKMAKAMGLNTIGTYVFWNLHEPQKGRFDFSGNNDVAEFVKIAREEGLWVILRPSPYVCAEWEFGGYPYWLQNEKGLILRSKDPQYLKEYETYITAVGKQLAPLQINHGGNILMVQIENEYGSYGKDKEYLRINQELFRKAGFDGLLYTCDPAADVNRGHLPGLLPAVNGLDDPAKIRKLVKDNHDGKGPYYIAEWYPAWFDWWGTAHHTVPAEKYNTRLDSVLTAGISINMYMFHGGTTRGFMNGANYKDATPYEPQTSSYDYDAPLDEAGNVTPKFLAFREVIKKHLPAETKLPPIPAAKPAMAIPAIKMNIAGSLLKNLPPPVSNINPLTFEDLNQDYGYVLYRTTLTGNKSGILKLKELRDYAIVMVNGKTIGTMDRRNKQDSLQLNLPSGEITLDILVENMGRINFGKYLLQNKKGITDKVTFGNVELKNWKMYRLPFASLAGIKYQANQSNTTPVVKKGAFRLKKVADTYLDMRSWGKGVVWVNGHNLGKYWSIGPQQTLYLPAEWLKQGLNKIEVLELLKPEQTRLSSLNKPILNQLNPGK